MDIQKLINEIVKEDDTGKYYVAKSVYDSLNLTEKDKKQLDEIFKKYGVSVKDMITSKDRSPLVRDYDYGLEESYEKRSLDEPRFASLGYNEDGQLISANFEKLDEFLEDFIANNVVMKQKRDKQTGEITLYPSIQLNTITKLKLSEEEQKHVMEYLSKHEIRVCGYSESLEDEFDNYDYYRTYKSSILPTPLSEKELMEKLTLYSATKDPFVREQIIFHNMRLVPYVAWRYSMLYGIDMHELESYGYEGLILSLEHYNPELGKFSTLAVHYIKGYIKRGIQEIMATKRGHFENAFVIAKQVVETEQGLSIVENPELVDDVVDLMIMKGDISEKKKEEAKRRIKLMYPETLSDIDNVIDEEQDVAGMASFELLKERLADILDTLTPIEEKVLRLRFGFEDGQFHGLEEVGRVFNVTRERIRQIEAKAIRKLRHPSRSKHVRDFLD